MRAGSGKGPDITYRATNIVAVVGNELKSNKGHIDKMVLIRGVQFLKLSLTYTITRWAKIYCLTDAVLWARYKRSLVCFFSMAAVLSC